MASGSWAAQAAGAKNNPFERAEFKVIHDSFNTSWQPRDSIEQSMADMLAQSFYTFSKWLEKANAMGLREYEVEHQLSREET